MAAAAARAVVKAPASSSICPRSPSVSMAAGPTTTPPSMTKRAASFAAVRNRTMCEATAVPKRLAASLAPRVQPKNKPLDSPSTMAKTAA